MYCFWENYIVRTDLQQLFRLFSSSFTHIIAWKEIYSEPKLYLEYMSFLAFCSHSLSYDVSCRQFANSSLKISCLLSWIPSASASG